MNISQGSNCTSSCLPVARFSIVDWENDIALKKASSGLSDVFISSTTEILDAGGKGLLIPA